MGLKAKWAIICSVLVILLYFLFAPRTVYPSDNPYFRQIAGDGWFITGDRDSRSKYFQVDGTDDMFFVCYFNGYVDAYTNNGEYQFTYAIHSSSQNGGASIMCTPELIYIQYKDSDVFAFRGTELVECMTHSQFQDMGYTMRPSGTVFIARNGVYRRDEGGTSLYQCALPEEIEKMFPVISVSADTERTIIIVLTGTIFMSFAYVIFIQTILRKRKER